MQNIELRGRAAELGWRRIYVGGFDKGGFFGLEGWVAELIPVCEDEDSARVKASFIGIFVNCSAC